MSNILLVSPPGSVGERLYSMVEVGSLSAVFKEAGFNTNIFDGYYFENPNAVDSHINKETLLIVIVLQWEHQAFIPWLINIISRISKHKDIHLTLMGRGATTLRTDLYKFYNDKIQSIILGDNVQVLLELAKNLTNKNKLSEIKGLMHTDDGKLTVNKPEDSKINLDQLPFSDRKYLSDKKAYPIVPFLSSKTCYGKCNFCINKVFRDINGNNASYIAMSSYRVVDEIEHINKKYGTTSFCFVDNNFFVDGQLGKERAVEIATEILNRQLKIKFEIECRVNDLDVETLTLLKKAGLRKIFLGIESGSQSVLDRFSKETTVSENIQAINILSNLRISFEPGFIMFDPLITLHELKENTSFIIKYELYNKKFSFGNSFFNKVKINRDSELYCDIPDNIKVNDVQNSSFINFKILDEKARAAEEIIQNKRQELDKVGRDLIAAGNGLNHLKWQKSRNKIEIVLFSLLLDWLDKEEVLSNEKMESISNILDNKILDHKSSYV